MGLLQESKRGKLFSFEQNSKIQVVMINQYRLLGIWKDESRMNELGSIGRLILCVFEAQQAIALISQPSINIIVLRRKGLP